MKTWVKLYTEIVGDPKMEQLTSDQFRLCINLLVVAGRIDQDGRLPPMDDVRWMLRLRPEHLARDLKVLAQVGIVTQTEGGWLVTDFAERQARRPSDEPEARNARKRLWRQSQADGIAGSAGLAETQDTAVAAVERGGNAFLG